MRSLFLHVHSGSVHDLARNERITHKRLVVFVEFQADEASAWTRLLPPREALWRSWLQPESPAVNHFQSRKPRPHAVKSGGVCTRWDAEFPRPFEAFVFSVVLFLPLSQTVI